MAQGAAKTVPLARAPLQCLISLAIGAREMADLRDVEKTIGLIARFIESVTDDDDFAHKL